MDAGEGRSATKVATEPREAGRQQRFSAVDVAGAAIVAVARAAWAGFRQQLATRESHRSEPWWL